MNRKAVQLSLQFLVTVVLAVVVLGAASVITFSLFSDSQELIERLSPGIEEDLAQQLITQQVGLAPRSVQASDNDQLVFGIGIYNNQATANFSVNANVVDIRGANQEFVLEQLSSFEVKQDTTGNTFFLVTLPDDAQGTFVLEVSVCMDNCTEQYGEKQTAFIVVS